MSSTSFKLLGMAFIAVFAAGYYLGIKNVSKTTTEVKQTTTDHIVTTTTKKPDGTVSIVEVQDVKSVKVKDKVAIVPVKANAVNVNVLGGLDTRNRAFTYGVEINKQVLGPINAGIWGLNNGIVGVSVGMQF